MEARALLLPEQPFLYRRFHSGYSGLGIIHSHEFFFCTPCHSILWLWKSRSREKLFPLLAFLFPPPYQRPFRYRTVAFLLWQSCSLSFSFHHLFSKLLYKVSLNALLITLTDFMKGNHRFPLSRGPSLNLKCWHFFDNLSKVNCLLLTFFSCFQNDDTF